MHKLDLGAWLIIGSIGKGGMRIEKLRFTTGHGCETDKYV
jgi:hypothetical protein